MFALTLRSRSLTLLCYSGNQIDFDVTRMAHSQSPTLCTVQLLPRRAPNPGTVNVSLSRSPPSAVVRYTILCLRRSGGTATVVCYCVIRAITRLNHSETALIAPDRHHESNSDSLTVFFYIRSCHGIDMKSVVSPWSVLIRSGSNSVENPRCGRQL